MTREERHALAARTEVLLKKVGVKVNRVQVMGGMVQSICKDEATAKKAAEFFQKANYLVKVLPLTLSGDGTEWMCAAKAQ